MATTKALLAPLLLAAMMALLASAAVDKPEIKTIDDNINMEVPQGKDIMCAPLSLSFVSRAIFATNMPASVSGWTHFYAR